MDAKTTYIPPPKATPPGKDEGGMKNALDEHPGGDSPGGGFVPRQPDCVGF
jgi:hypothetical protein